MGQQFVYGQFQNVRHAVAVDTDAESLFSKSTAATVRTRNPAPVIFDLAQPEAGLTSAPARVPAKIGGLEIQADRFRTAREDLPQVVGHSKQRPHGASSLGARRPRFERQDGRDVGRTFDAVPGSAVPYKAFSVDPGRQLLRQRRDENAANETRFPRTRNPRDGYEPPDRNVALYVRQRVDVRAGYRDPYVVRVYGEMAAVLRALRYLLEHLLRRSLADDPAAVAASARANLNNLIDELSQGSPVFVYDQRVPALQAFQSTGEPCHILFVETPRGLVQHQRQAFPARAEKGCQPGTPAFSLAQREHSALGRNVPETRRHESGCCYVQGARKRPGRTGQGLLHGAAWLRQFPKLVEREIEEFMHSPVPQA